MYRKFQIVVGKHCKRDLQREKAAAKSKLTAYQTLPDEPNNEE
jgi:hypothetical protein